MGELKEKPLLVGKETVANLLNVSRLTGTNGQAPPPDKQVQEAENRATRDPRGKFLPGVSGNLKGRPKEPTVTEAMRRFLGAKNKDGQTLREELAMLLLTKAIAYGDMKAIRYVVDRLEGTPRASAADDTVNLDLPPLTDAQSCKDAAAIIMQAMADGAITVDTASRVIAVVERCKSVVGPRPQDAEAGRSLVPDRRYL